jgi:hypothetical protein
VEHEGAVRTFVDPIAGTPTDVVTDVAADDFADHWLNIVIGGDAA